MSTFKDYLETTHYVDPAWEAIDQGPQQEDGREWWDTDESASDPDDEGGEEWEWLFEEDAPKPPQPKNLLKHFLRQVSKNGTGTCKPGQTAAQTDCTPASGEGGKKPGEEGEDEPEEGASSQPDEVLDVEEILTTSAEDGKEITVEEAGPAALIPDIAKPLPTNPFVDVSKWDPKKDFADVWAGKLAMLDGWVKQGDYDAIEKGLSFANGVSEHKMLPYALATYKAFKDALAKKLVGGEAKKDISTWQKIGGQLGSNPGIQMEDPDTGLKYYVKYAKSPAHAANEVLAGKLYELAGASIPQLDVVDTPQGVGVASKWMNQKQDFKPSNAQDKAAACENFAVHAWLGNWDAVGLANDNQVWTDKGLVTVDAGGSMLYRAQGKPKPFEGGEVKEWATMRDPKVNAEAAAVFGGMTNDQLVQAAQKVTGISKEAISALADKFGPEGKKDQLKIALLERQQWIKEWVDGTKKAVEDGTKPPPSAVPPKLPAKPFSTNKIASSKFDELEVAATKGLAAIVAVKTNLNKASKALHYKHALIAALKGGAKSEEATVPKLESKLPQPGPKPVKPGKIKESEFPEQPKFATSLGAGNFTKAASAANKKVVDELLGLAKAGDLDALQAHPVTQSFKVQAYKNGLVASVAAQLNPSPPPKTYDGAWSDIKKVFKSVKDAPAQVERIGFFLVTENPGVIDASFPEVKWDIDSSYKIKDAKEQLRHDKAIKDLPADARDALKSYTSSWYGTANNALRTGVHNAKAVKLGEALIEHGVELVPGTVLHRGIDVSDDIVAKIKASVGKVLQEPGFSSTAIGYGSGGNVKWKIKTAPGAKGIYVGTLSHHKSESEMVTPPGTRLLIQSVKIGKYKRIEVEAIMLPTLSEQCC